jgi:membrane protein
MMTVLFSILAADSLVKNISVDIQNFIFKNFYSRYRGKNSKLFHDFATQASNLTIVGVFMLFLTAL